MKPRLCRATLAALARRRARGPGGAGGLDHGRDLEGRAFRGPAGGNDEFIEIKNISGAPVAIGGWQLWGSNSSRHGAERARRRSPTGTDAGGRHDLPVRPTATGSRTSAATDDRTGTGIADNGGLQLRNAAAHRDRRGRQHA